MTKQTRSCSNCYYQTECDDRKVGKCWKWDRQPRKNPSDAGKPKGFLDRDVTYTWGEFILVVFVGNLIVWLIAELIKRLLA
jgi:hypothetical protein